MVLTTKYLAEAESLADEVLVLSAGCVVASGSPEKLKRRVGSQLLSLAFPDAELADRAIGLLSDIGLFGAFDPTKRTVAIPVHDTQDVVAAMRTVDIAQLAVTAVQITEPTLEDVYLTRTASRRPTDEPRRGTCWQHRLSQMHMPEHIHRPRPRPHRAGCMNAHPGRDTRIRAQQVDRPELPDRERDEPLGVLLPPDVGERRDRRHTVVTQLAGDQLGVFHINVANHDAARLFAAEPERERGTDSARGPSDHNDLAV